MIKTEGFRDFFLLQYTEIHKITNLFYSILYPGTNNKVLNYPTILPHVNEYRIIVTRSNIGGGFHIFYVLSDIRKFDIKNSNF